MMREMMRGILFATLALSVLLTGAAGVAHARPKTGEAAPLFVLKNIRGLSFELAAMRDQPMVILYFFDVDSTSSQEGLLHLDKLAKRYKDADLVVWGISRSSKAKISEFLERSLVAFPVLVDSGKVSDIYSARTVLPTICILGPELKLLDYFQGGGRTTENMLVALAERNLQRRKTELARAISRDVTRKNPDNARAKTVHGYAQLKEGDLKGAEKTFYRLSRKEGQAEILGNEGLSQVYAQKGEPEKAIKTTRKVEAHSRARAHTHVVKGDLLYSQKETAAAEAEYRQAIGKTGGAGTYRAVAYNQLGRIYAIDGRYLQSRKMYDEAVALDPYYVEATSNKGMAYERQGMWDKALEAYRRAQAIDRNDPFAAALAANAKKMLLLDKDPDQSKELERRIETYVSRYWEAAASEAEFADDEWTSGATVMSLFRPTEAGGLSMRDGFGRILALQLGAALNASGRIRVIEPIVLKRVTARLGLLPGDLADDETMRRLARAFGARLIAKGSLFHLSEGTLLNLKLVLTDNPRKVLTIQRQFASAATLKKDLHWLNREILTSVMSKYPLQAFVVDVTGNQVLLNLGADQGVVSGAIFDVVEVKAPVNFKGKRFVPEPAVMATVEVVKVDADFSYAHITDQRRPVQPEDKLRERLERIEENGNRVW